MEELIRNLLNRLEQIGIVHEELYDTECRERMSDVIFNNFIRPVEGFVVPSDYGLYTFDANSAVGEALAAYATAANAQAIVLNLTTFHERLSAFQISGVRSDGGNYFDDFFGYCHPEAFNEEGGIVV